MRLSITLLLLAPCLAIAEEPSRLDALLERARPVLDGVDAAPAPATAVPVGDPLKLDAATSVAMALKQNAQIAISDEGLTQAEARIGQAKAARKPQVKSQLGVTYIDGLEGIVTSSKLIEGLIGIGDIQPDKTIARGTVSVEQVLYAGGQIAAAIRASRVLAQSESWQREVTRAQVALDTTQAYQDAVMTQALIEVAHDSVTAFERHRDDAVLEGMGRVARVVLHPHGLGTEGSGEVVGSNQLGEAGLQARTPRGSGDDRQQRLVTPHRIGAGLDLLAGDCRSVVRDLEGAEALEAGVARIEWVQCAALAALQGMRGTDMGVRSRNRHCSRPPGSSVLLSGRSWHRNPAGLRNRDELES